MAENKLKWQSKLVLLIVLPAAAASVVLRTPWWAENVPAVAILTVGLSAVLALIVVQLRSATPGAAFTGAAITAWLMYSTTFLPYRPWETALTPVLALFMLTHISTRLGRERKRQLGLAERRQGRSAAQVAANLGVAAFVFDGIVRSWLADSRGTLPLAGWQVSAVGLAALAEAAADTVSSEVGQVLGGRPRMITTLRQVESGVDGGITLIGTLAGVMAAAIVALLGALVLSVGFMPSSKWLVFRIACGGGVFGLFFDSLLGATLEKRGWLNNDAVNFLSTASAAGFAAVVLALMR